jgi:TPP-dependent pyruvate/acetoin dehydrogenase alpha subunit
LAGLLAAGAPGISGLLPDGGEQRSRLLLALGAAAALKVGAPGRVVVVFGEHGKPGVWRKTLRIAAAEALPVLFVVLVSAESAARDLAALATRLGVPGIGVEATDAVALYRVAGECVLRARAGGGPALMHCVPFVPVGKKARALDPVAVLGEHLRKRGLMDREEAGGVAEVFRAKLRAAGYPLKAGRGGVTVRRPG